MNMRQIVERDRLVRNLALARVQAQRAEQNRIKEAWIAENGREPSGLTMWSATGAVGLKRFL